VAPATGTAGAAARLEVSGEVLGGAEDRIDVRIGLANRGEAAARVASVEAELFGHRDTRRLESDILPGQTGTVRFSFPLAEAVAGVHAIVLHLEYRSPGGPGDAELLLLQPAYVLVALGEAAAPAVTLTAPEARMDSVGRWRIGLESHDGAAHRVWLRAVLPRHLRVDPAESLVEVPAAGRVERELLLFRVDAPWESTQGALLLASTEGEELVRTSAAVAVVRVGHEPGWLPRLRRPLVALMLALFLAAAYFELRRRWSWAR